MVRALLVQLKKQLFPRRNVNSRLPLEETITQIHQAKILFLFSEEVSPMLETHGSFSLFFQKTNRKLDSLIPFRKKNKNRKIERHAPLN